MTVTVDRSWDEDSALPPVPPTPWWLRLRRMAAEAIGRTVMAAVWLSISLGIIVVAAGLPFLAVSLLTTRR